MTEMQPNSGNGQKTNSKSPPAACVQVPIYSSGPFLLFWLAGLGPVFVYSVTKRRDWPNKLRIAAIIFGILLTIAHLLAATLIILIARLGALPPWSDKFFATSLSIWFVTLALLLAISTSVKRLSRRWLASVIVMIISAASFCIVNHPLEYWSAFAFRLTMTNTAKFHLPEGADYSTIGNYTIAGFLTLPDTQFSEPNHPETTFTSHGYFVNLGPGVRRIKTKWDSEVPKPFFKTDSYVLMFFKPIEFNISKLGQDQPAPQWVKHYVDSIFRFESDFAFARQMYNTKYNDILKAKSLAELVKAESLYLFKQMLNIIEPPIYEFDNGHVKGFVGPRSDEGFTALVFKENGEALCDLLLRPKEDSNQAPDREYLLRILASMRKDTD